MTSISKFMSVFAVGVSAGLASASAEAAAPVIYNLGTLGGSESLSVLPYVIFRSILNYRLAKHSCDCRR